MVNGENRCLLLCEETLERQAVVVAVHLVIGYSVLDIGY